VARVIAGMRSRPARWRAEETTRRVAENGDSAFMDPEARSLTGLPGVSGWLFAVADGLGGEGHDDVASQTAVEALGKLFRGEERLQSLDFDTPDGWLRAVYDQVNRTLCDLRAREGLEGAYTTLTAALLVAREDGRLHCYPANVGDSRLYLLRGHRLVCVTRDDGEGGMVSRVIGDPHLFNASYLRYATTVGRTRSLTSKVLKAIEAVLKKRVGGMDDREARLTAPLFLAVLEGAYPVELASSYSPPVHRLATRLGADAFARLLRDVSRVYVRMASRLAAIELKPDDRILLCTDGISNAFTESFIREAIDLRAGEHVEQEVERILAFLMEAPGWVDDDRTAVLVHVAGVE